MTAVKLTKIIGIICIIFVFCGMMIPGTYTILIGLIVLLPLTLYTRHLMQQEEEATKQHLQQYSASCGFRGICYEGYKNVSAKECCEILFKRKEIIILGIDKNEHLIRKTEIAKDNIKEVKLLDLGQIKEVSQTDMYVTLGKLGKYFYTNIDNPQIVKRNRKDGKVKYLFIRFLDNEKNIRVISFFSNAEYQDFNRRASMEYTIEKFCKDNY